MTAKRIFISYARKDGAGLAKRLRDDLDKQGHPVWLDTEQIDSGGSWSKDIEKAINECDVTLALLSQGSFVSEICRAEQIMSLDKGKAVIPLLVEANAPRPIHLYTRQYVDFSADDLYAPSLATLLDDIRKDAAESPRAVRKIRNNAPRLPQNFIPREAELNQLRERLLSDESDRKLALTALRGMGGIGKSVLAAAICHDPLAQAAFPDGIAWVTIGRTPGSLVEAMRTVGEALGDAGGAYSSETAAVSRLRELLREKSALIVLDDAWDAAHVEPFLAEAPRCRFLITTREGKVATRLGAHELRIHEMKPEEALRLLHEWAGRDDPDFGTIAKKVGYLPLALKLAGARLREGMSGAEWLEAFAENVSQLKLDYDSDSPQESITACLELSVSRLKADEQPLYHALGIFKDDTRIPQATIAKLWRQTKPSWNDHQCSEFLQHLDRLALLELDRTTKLTVLHDLLNDYTQEKLKADNRYQPMHDSLLNAYNPVGTQYIASAGESTESVSRISRWHEVADGYLLAYLVYHLIEAGRADELPGLFVDDAWMQARWEADGYVYIGFIEDLMTAWKIVRKKAVEDDMALAQCVHYALIRTTFNSLAANYVPELVARAVETELSGWSFRRGMSIAANVPDAEQKANLYTLLLKTNKGSTEERQKVQEQIIKFALVLDDKFVRAKVLAKLATLLSGEQKHRVLEQILTTALTIKDKNSREGVLVWLAEHVSEELAEQALKPMLTIRYGSTRVDALVKLAEHLSGEQKQRVLEQALVAALPDRGGFFHEDGLAKLVGQLSGELLQRALDAALALKESDRARVLEILAPQLSGELLQRALDAALALKDESHCARVLAGLAGHLSGVLLERALDVVLGFKYGYALAEALGGLAPQLSREQLERALDAALALKIESHRARALAGLVGQLSEEQKQMALEQVHIATLAPIHVYDHETRALAGLAEQLSGASLERALDVALEILRESDRATALAGLAEQLSGASLERALDAALAIEDKYARAGALAGLAGQLKGDLLRRGLDAALAIRDESNRASVLAGLAGQLKGDLLRRGLDAAFALKDKYARVRVLAGLAGQLTGEPKQIALERGLEAALALPEKEEEYSYRNLRAKALEALAGQLSEILWKRGLEATLALKDKADQARVLEVFVGQVSAVSVEWKLEMVLEIENNFWRTRVLGALAPQLSGELLKRGLDAALTIKDGSIRTSALAGHATRLSDDLLERSSEITQGINSESSWVATLETPATGLSDKLQNKRLETALKIENQSGRAWALVKLAKQSNRELLGDVFKATLTIKDVSLLGTILKVLAPQLNEEQLYEALRTALTIRDETTRSSVLTHIVGQMSR